MLESKTALRVVFFDWIAYMKDFLLNFTRIVEANAKTYWSIIFGIALCLILFITEVIHIQNIITSLASKDQQILQQAIQPITQIYTWARILVMLLALMWSHYEYRKTKKKLAL